MTFIGVGRHRGLNSDRTASTAGGEPPPQSGSPHGPAPDAPCMRSIRPLSIDFLHSLKTTRLIASQCDKSFGFSIHINKEAKQVHSRLMTKAHAYLRVSGKGQVQGD